MERILNKIKQNPSNFSGSEFYVFLLDLIPYLKYFPYVQGGEGKAYFLMNKYIVKEYVEIHDEEFFDVFFEEYCKEMQAFSKKQYLVPKIYSWVKVPQVIVKSGSPKIQYKHYILEEQIKGRPLFSGFLEDTYHICRDLCDKKKFKQTIQNPYQDKNLFNEIIKTYIKDFLMMNQTIESLSDKQIEDFIMTIYHMFEEGEYSLPDMYPSNMIYTGKDIVAIDNHFSYRAQDITALAQTPDSFTLSGLLFMFLYNESISDLKHMPYYLSEGLNSDVEFYINKNIDACEVAIKRVLDVAKKCMDRPSVQNKKILSKIYQMLKNIMGKERAISIVKDVKTM